MTSVGGRLAGRLALAGYRCVGALSRPIVPFVLAARVRRGKEDAARLGERYGRASQSRPPGACVWVHAASVGETNTVLPLIERLAAAGHAVVLTTITVTAARIAAMRLPAGAVHQFSPIDTPASTRAFLSHWRPDCVILAESEIWPQMVARLAADGIPLILVNGRMSPRSFAGWRRSGGIARFLFSKITLCLAQSAGDGERFAALGVPAVRVTGNLKFDAPPPTADAAALARWRDAAGARPVLLAASTHPSEEAVVAEAHAAVARRHPDLLTVIVPRHPERGGDIRAEFGGRGLSVRQRSRGEALAPDAAIYLADTLGELGLFYRACPIAFVGGSLVPSGGHNPIEPIRLGASVLHGPDVENFVEIYAALDAAVPAGRITDAASLAAAAAALLADPELRRAAAARAAAALEPFSGALAATLTGLDPYLPGPRAARPDALS